MEANDPEVVVITGASAGVGRATVREFARHGAHVGLLARNEDGLEGARREVEEAGGRVLALPTDVADPDQVEEAARRVEEELGPIDVWVNDAMTTIFSPVWEIEPQEFKRATGVTYLGAVYGTMAALGRMKPRDRGKILQVGSALSYRAIPLQSAYCGQARHEGIYRLGTHRAYARGLWGDHHDGPASGPKHPPVRHLPQQAGLSFPARAAHLPAGGSARAIYWAAHSNRREVYVGRSSVITIVGNKVAPWAGDLYLAKTGFSGQQTGERISPDRPDNLFEPVSGDHGSHGSFEGQSYERSPQLWLTQNRGWIPAAILGGGLLCTALLRRRG